MYVSMCYVSFVVHFFLFVLLSSFQLDRRLASALWYCDRFEAIQMIFTTFENGHTTNGSICLTFIMMTALLCDQINACTRDAKDRHISRVLLSYVFVHMKYTISITHSACIVRTFSILWPDTNGKIIALYCVKFPFGPVFYSVQLLLHVLCACLFVHSMKFHWICAWRRKKKRYKHFKWRQQAAYRSFSFSSSRLIFFSSFEFVLVSIDVSFFRSIHSVKFVGRLFVQVATQSLGTRFFFICYDDAACRCCFMCCLLLLAFGSCSWNSFFPLLSRWLCYFNSIIVFGACVTK